MQTVTMISLLFTQSMNGRKKKVSALSTKWVGEWVEWVGGVSGSPLWQVDCKPQQGAL